MHNNCAGILRNMTIWIFMVNFLVFLMHVVPDRFFFQSSFVFIIWYVFLVNCFLTFKWRVHKRTRLRSHMWSFLVVFAFLFIFQVFIIYLLIMLFRNLIKRIVSIFHWLYFLGSMLSTHLVEGFVLAGFLHFWQLYYYLSRLLCLKYI